MLSYFVLHLRFYPEQVVPKFYAMRKVEGEERAAVVSDMQKLLEQFEKELGDKKYFGGASPVYMYEE